MKYCIAILLLAILAVAMAEKVSQSEKIDAKEQQADSRSKRGFAHSGYDTLLVYPYTYHGHDYGYDYPYGYPYGYQYGYPSYYPTYRYHPHHYYDSHPHAY